MDLLDAVTPLLAVVDTGSFSAASRRLHVPVTTVQKTVLSVLIGIVIGPLAIADALEPSALVHRQLAHAPRTRNPTKAIPSGTCSSA